ncbi:hypothetical protein SpCBS45565_g05418 [Spizellomyces sp. 'palustris']|nr:hypothetical protein SpCBS45565_g05418 [Spizellomyces sp. 'palustris']
MPGQLAEPVLTVAFNNIQKLTSIDESDLQTIWNGKCYWFLHLPCLLCAICVVRWVAKALSSARILILSLVFTKCKDNLENGRRLENISWRLWYRSCHGHSPKEDASPLHIPSVQPKSQKSPHVSPESFNRLLKKAVEDSKNTTAARKESTANLVQLKADAAASILQEHQQQEQQPEQPQGELWQQPPLHQDSHLPVAALVLTPPAPRVAPPPPAAAIQRCNSAAAILKPQQPTRTYAAPLVPAHHAQAHISPAVLTYRALPPSVLAPHPQPTAVHPNNDRPKVKFFISESHSPDTPERLPQRRALPARSNLSTCTSTTTRNPVTAAAAQTTATTTQGYESDDDFSDSDFSDFSDSEDYSDDESDEPSSTDAPISLFRKVDIYSQSAAARTVTPKRSLLSVALKEGSALKRAKPSQFRNLNAMGRPSRDECETASAGTTSELSQSLRENLECERRMMPYNMRFARGVHAGGASAFNEEGYW